MYYVKLYDAGGATITICRPLLPALPHAHPHMHLTSLGRRCIGLKGIPAPARTVKMLPGDIDKCIKFGLDLLSGRVTEPATPRGHGSKGSGYRYPLMQVIRCK